MQIHRIPKHAPGYTILDNGHVVRKHSLSWAARGLLGYLLSLPDGSREDVRTLAAKSVEGRGTVSRALRELEDAGHYIRRTDRDPVTGRVRTTVSVHEVPATSKTPNTLPPLPALPAAGGPGAGHPIDGKAGDPSVRVMTAIRKDVEVPSVPPADELLTEDPGLMPPADPDELAEAHSAFSALLGGADGALPAEPEDGPQATAERLPRPRQAATRPHMTDGMALLLELGSREPRMTLAGKPLADQSVMVEGLLAGGWAAEELLRILSAPLPEKITRSVGAIISGRLSKIPSAPAVQSVVTAEPPRPHQRSDHECLGREGLCGRPVPTAGRLCSACR
ncbi:helix-turn-helix domain-containing protein [Kitasatospora sp. NPDC127111]|uniref:helix-turn-helix domain-containing protein n=1 Tax=Kitasatospora sp. NPDC127111 TaxID=3345363 RepID=UPI00362F471D